MKQIIIKIVLLLLFAGLTIAIILPFVAEERFKLAQHFEMNYRWKTARDNYRAAVKFSPCNTKYISEYGSFLQRQSMFQQDGISLLKSAEKIQQRAVRLNPWCATYYSRAGGIQIGIYKVELDRNMLTHAIRNFKRAFESDPKGLNTSYSIGLFGVEAWRFLDNSERDFILQRLRYVLGLQPWRLEYIYFQIQRHSKDLTLLQHVTRYCLPYLRSEGRTIGRRQRIANMKEAALHGAHVGNVVLQKNWQRKAKDGKCFYENGEMYWNGVIDAAITMPQGKTVIKVQAKGSQANGVWAYMIAELDGKEIGGTFVDSQEWKDYEFQGDTEGGVKVLSITFSNDGGEWEKGHDRNLYIGKVRVISDE